MSDKDNDVGYSRQSSGPELQGSLAYNRQFIEYGGRTKTIELITCIGCETVFTRIHGVKGAWCALCLQKNTNEQTRKRQEMLRGNSRRR